MRREYRTSCYGDFDVDIRSMDSLPDRAEHGDGEVGFRLVHDDERRVYRGGSWHDAAVFARAAFRDWDSPGFRSDILGLRLVFDRDEGGT